MMNMCESSGREWCRDDSTARRLRWWPGGVFIFVKPKDLQANTMSMQEKKQKSKFIVLFLEITFFVFFFCCWWLSNWNQSIVTRVLLLCTFEMRTSRILCFVFIHRYRMAFIWKFLNFLLHILCFLETYVVFHFNFIPICQFFVDNLFIFERCYQFKCWPSINHLVKTNKKPKFTHLNKSWLDDWTFFLSDPNLLNPWFLSKNLFAW